MNPFWKMAAPWIGGAAVLMAIGTGVLLYGSSRYDAGVDKTNADHALAELNEFKTQTGRLAGIATTFEASVAELRGAEPKIIERYTRVEVQSPLPAATWRWRCSMGSARRGTLPQSRDGPSPKTSRLRAHCKPFATSCAAIQRPATRQNRPEARPSIP